MKKRIGLVVLWVVFIILVSIALSSCNFPKPSVSEVMTETGVIVAKEFNARISGSTNTVNMDMNGNLGVGMGSVSVPEKFTVVMQCNHGDIFTVNNKKVFAAVSVGDSVIISYKELYLEKKDGSKRRYGYDFINAVKIK